MSDEAAFGHVSDIRVLKSQGIVRLSIDLPEESFVELVGLLHNRDVLVTLAPAALGSAYGVYRTEQDATPTARRSAADGYGKAYELLHRAGWLYNPQVAPAIATDDAFLAWLRTQPCAHCGRAGETQAAHVRRLANGAGIGIKPPYSAIPLCGEHHQAQHQHGESVLGGKEWFDRQRGRHLAEFLWDRLHEIFEVDSMSMVTPAGFRAWCGEKGILHTLPGAFPA